MRVRAACNSSMSAARVRLILLSAAARSSFNARVLRSKLSATRPRGCTREPPHQTYIIQATVLYKAMRPVGFDLIAFDADDTLWHNERTYRDARQQFCRVLAAAGVTDGQESIEAYVS